MRLEDRIKLRWVRGNDVTLRVMLTEPECDSNGVPVKNGRKQSWKAVDLDTYEQINAKLKRMFTGFTAMDTMCGQVEEPCCYPVESGKGDADGVLIVEAPGTLPVGIYALEVTGMCDGRSMRSFETMLFGIVECNGKANATFDVIEGQKSADVDIKVQLVSSATVRGKNAYELWKEIPGNENKTLQEYLDGIVSGEAEQADWNATNPQSRAYIKNKPDVYDKSYIDDALSDIQSSLTFDNVPVSGSSNPVTSDGIKRYVDAHQPDLSGKQDVISDLAAIRSGAALGTTAVQTETDPTVPAWAKTSTKPSYTAQEVGALPADTQFMNINGANVKSNNSINVYTQTAADSRFASKTELSGYATETYVNNALVNVVYAGEDVGSANSEGDGEGSGDVTPSGDYVTTSDFNAAMLTKANDSAVVHKTGSETISGEKNFNDRILLHSTIASEQEPVEGEEQTNTTEDTVLSGSYIYHQGHADFSWITTSADEEADVDDSISLQSALDKKVSTSSNRLLPTVTATNNGKILKVVNGVWTLSDDATGSGGGGVDSTAVHQTGAETVDGVKTLIGTLAVEDGRGGQISCTDLDNFDWIVVRGGTTLQSVLTAMTNRIAALETKLASIYSYDSSTNTLTINDPNSNS